MVHEEEEERRGRGGLRQEIVLMALCERETVVGLDFEALWGGRIDGPMEMKNSSVGESLIVTPTYQTSLVRTSPFGSFRILGPRHQFSSSVWRWFWRCKNHAADVSGLRVTV